jgi:hypothetical protein
MCAGSPTAGTWSSSRWRPDNEFETDRPSTYPSNPGTPTTLTVLATTITDNDASGGKGDHILTDGLGVGGGLYVAPAGIVCIDVDTSIFENHASGGDDDVFGFFTICP